MRAIALLTFLALVACHNDAASQYDASVVPASAAPPTGYSAQSPQYTVMDNGLRLVITGEACVLEYHASGGSKVGKLMLDLHPPCYLLTWQQPPPTPNQEVSVSDGLPIGSVGDPMAWQYASAGGVVVLAVIGDPFPEKLRTSNLYRLRKQQGLTCASSVQAILLHGDQMQLSKKREHVDVFCTELGLEEKDFWMLSHQ